MESEDKEKFGNIFNKRYVASFRIPTKELNDSIQGTKANEKLRLKMNIKNDDDDKVMFYFKSANLNVEYGIDGI